MTAARSPQPPAADPRLAEVRLLEGETLDACVAVGESILAHDGKHQPMARLIQCCEALARKRREVRGEVTP